MDFGVCSHSESSCCRNLHCRPILMAGSSLHSAQRQTARVEIPSHFATAAVVKRGSQLNSNFSMGLFRYVERSVWRRWAELLAHVHGAQFPYWPLILLRFSLCDFPPLCQGTRERFLRHLTKAFRIAIATNESNILIMRKSPRSQSLQ